MRKYENFSAAFVEKIISDYIPAFVRLRAKLRERYGTLLTAPDAPRDH